MTLTRIPNSMLQTPGGDGESAGVVVVASTAMADITAAIASAGANGRVWLIAQG